MPTLPSRHPSVPQLGIRLVENVLLLPARPAIQVRSPAAEELARSFPVTVHPPAIDIRMTMGSTEDGIDWLRHRQDDVPGLTLGS